MNINMNILHTFIKRIFIKRILLNYGLFAYIYCKLTWFFSLLNLPIPKPHIFINKNMHSGIQDFTDAITEIDRLLPQLAGFIQQFNSLIVETGINVITDSNGSMSIDVPENMPASVSDKIVTKVGIIDNLIGTHKDTISDIFEKKLSLEVPNRGKTSIILSKLEEFEKLKSSYKH